uniref:3CxxC-type domain-containing protein n=1 Tax=Scleropages formosus TaxID=113540 RepID=A0A8C9RT28_SCLFO
KASRSWYIWMFQQKVKELDKEDSWFIEFDDTIETERTASGSKKYICRPFSRFTCSICHHRWASSKSMVVGVVKVRRYKQNCERCEGATFEEPNRILKGGHVSKHCEAAGQVCVTCAKDTPGRSVRRPPSWEPKAAGGAVVRLCRVARGSSVL